MSNFNDGFHNGFWDRPTTDLNKIGDPEYMAGHMWGSLMSEPSHSSENDGASLDDLLFGDCKNQPQKIHEVSNEPMGLKDWLMIGGIIVLFVGIVCFLQFTT